MKRYNSFSFLCLFAAVLLSAAGRANAAEETAAEKLRKALDEVRDLEIAEQSLDKAVNQLREQTGINLRIDEAAVPSLPLGGQMGGISSVPVQPGTSSFYANVLVRGQFHGLPLRTILTKLLRDHNLAHVLVSDTVLITTPDKAAQRQLGQSVSVNLEGIALRDALTKLARETGANLVLDPRMAKQGQTALTLRLDEVPLTTVVDLLADEAGLRAVRLHNVLYVTSEERAEKLHKALHRDNPPVSGWLVYPDGIGGFRLTPPEGTPSTGLGISGQGGIMGLGGGGITGLGGGGFNFQGGMPRGVTPPVPLSPPVRKNQPAPAKKPAKEATPTKTNKVAFAENFVARDDPPQVATDQSATKERTATRDKPAKQEAENPAVCESIATYGFTPRHSLEGRELGKKLAQRIRWEGMEDARATLTDALDSLGKRYGLAFEINEEAFKIIHLAEVGRKEIAQPTPIPEMNTVLVNVLRKVLYRVSPSATLLLRGDHIEITTEEAIRKEFFADRPTSRMPLPPLVSGTFEKATLQAALKELGWRGNVVLDSRAAKEAQQMTLTTELENVPLDTAVRMIADMAGLKVVMLDNAYYVTSKPNASELMQEQETQRQQLEAELKQKAREAAEKAKTPEAKPTPPKKDTAPKKKTK